MAAWARSSVSLRMSMTMPQRRPLSALGLGMTLELALILGEDHLIGGGHALGGVQGPRPKQLETHGAPQAQRGRDPGEF